MRCGAQIEEVLEEHTGLGPAERRRKVLSAPEHPYTKMLIGSVPGHEPPDRPAVLESAPVVLRTERLDKRYTSFGIFGQLRSVDAAAAVSIEVRKGETLGIVGESGSGKSTVARCVARLIETTDGRILLSGEDIARMPTRQLRRLRRKVQIVFQDPYRSLNPRRTVDLCRRRPAEPTPPSGSARARARSARPHRSIPGRC